MVKLNLGSGNNLLPDFINIDKDVVLPFPPEIKFLCRNIEEFIKTDEIKESTVSFIKAYHILEHINDLDSVMKWIHKVCTNEATVDIVVPLANTLWSVANPDHKREFNHRTFQYYTKDFVTSDLGLFRGFEIVKQTIEREPNEWFGGIEWIVANLHTILKVVK